MADTRTGRMAVKKPQLMIGGLLRCCVATWDLADLTDLPPGHRLPCLHCSSAVVRDDDPETNVWRWEGSKVDMMEDR